MEQCVSSPSPRGGRRRQNARSGAAPMAKRADQGWRQIGGYEFGLHSSVDDGLYRRCSWCLATAFRPGRREEYVTM